MEPRSDRVLRLKTSEAPNDVAESLSDSATVASRRRPSKAMVVGLGLLALFFVVKAWGVEPVRVHHDSMRPNLRDGDALLIDKFSYLWRDPRVGEIVTAHLPGTGESVVKRVVALGGDSIGIVDGVLTRNGQPVDDSYANRENMAGYFWGPVDVPEGQVFLLGDNRIESVDSRDYGPVPVDSIDGRLLVRFWPL